jgi:hypothetical protein
MGNFAGLAFTYGGAAWLGHSGGSGQKVSMREKQGAMNRAKPGAIGDNSVF